MLSSPPKSYCQTSSRSLDFDSTCPAFSISTRSRLNSVGESCTGRPSRVTWWLSGSSSRSTDDQPAVRLPAAGAAQNGPDAQDQLLQVERLGDVVVTARPEPADPVLGRVAGGEEQHGRMPADAAGCCPRSRRTTSKPSTSGSITSSTIRSGRCSPHRGQRLRAGRDRGPRRIRPAAGSRTATRAASARPRPPVTVPMPSSVPSPPDHPLPVPACSRLTVSGGSCPVRRCVRRRTTATTAAATNAPVAMAM